MSSWLSNRLGIHWNLRPLAAPAGAIIGGALGGPVGAGIGAGLFKSGDNLAHGDSVAHSLGQGALNGLAYGAGAGILDKLRGAGSVAQAGAPSSAVADASGIGGESMGVGPLGPGSAPGSAAGAASAASAPGQTNAYLDALKGTGSAIKNNPLVAGQVAGGVLNTREQGAALDFQKQQYQDEQNRRKRIADILGPIYQQMMASRAPIAPNPYAPR